MRIFVLILIGTFLFSLGISDADDWDDFQNVDSTVTVKDFDDLKI